MISEAEPATDTPSCALLEGLKKKCNYLVFLFKIKCVFISNNYGIVIPFLILAVLALCPQQHASPQMTTCHLDDLKTL